MTTSARPDHLDRFVDRAAPRRRAAADTHQRVATLTGQVRRNSVDFDVDTPSIVALSGVWANTESTEAFVTAIRAALVGADGTTFHGVVTVGDAATATALAAGGVPPDPVEFEATTMVGLPVTSGFVDDPICSATGNMVHQDLDLDHPGLAAALDLTRTYNSVVGDRPGVFGPGWSTVLDCFLVPGDERIEVRLPDGATVAWVHTPTGWASAGRRLHDVQATDVGWEVATDLQHALRFDAAGRLVGWVAGPSEVDVARRDGRIVALSDRRTGRSVVLDWIEDAAGPRVAGVTAGDGRTARFGYDPAGRLASATGPDGAPLAYEWVDGRLRSVTDADGVQPFVNDYDERGRVVRQVNPFGRTTHYRYDDHGLTVITDEVATRQAMVHDRRGNLTAVIDADGSAMRLAYDHADRVVKIVERDGAIWHHTYDPVSGRLAERRDPDGLCAGWTWDPFGRVRTHTDRGGATTFFEYPDGDGPAGRPLVTPARVIDALGESIDVDVDTALDRPRSITDADGVTVVIEHDADGQPVAVVDGLGGRTTIDRDAAGRIRRIVDPLGVATTIAHDLAGRIVAHERAGAGGAVSRTASGRVVEVRLPGDPSTACTAEIGPHGAPIAITDAAGCTTRFEYDTMGNVVATVAADGATFHQFFDPVGRLVGTADPAGATTHLRHDRAGRVVELVDPDGRTWRRDVDELGRTVRSYDPLGAVTAAAYHPCGSVASVELATGELWRTEVDHHGRTTAVVAPDGRRHEFVYSAAGRLVARRLPDGGVEMLEYDAAGRLAGATGVDGARRTIERDAAGRLLRARRDVDDGAFVEVDRDVHGRTVGRRTPVGRDEFERDAAGRLLAHIDGTGARRTFEWDARDLLAAATDPSGAVLRYDYDGCGRLITQTVDGQAPTRFGYAASGRLATIVDAAGVTTAFGYDLAGHLVELRRGDAGWSSTLDPVGRVVARHDLAGAVLGRFEYDAAGRVLDTERADDDPAASRARAVRHPVERDAAGRVVLDEDGIVYHYDAAGRPVHVERHDGDDTRYEYDGQGLLAVERTARGTRHFRYDAAGRVVAATDAAGTTCYEYDAAGRRSAEVRPDGSRCDLLWAGLDRLVGISDASGTKRSITIDHDAFGRPVRVGGEPVGHDLTLGSLSFLGARVLDAATGQFLSPDPLLPVPGSIGAVSAYTHAWLDPVNHVDPTGERPISIEEWEQIRTREERGTVGAAIDAVPWDAVAAVGVVAVGAGLMFVPGGQLIGGGILIGAASSGVVGVVMGDVDPLDVALGGVLGGIGGGVGLAVKGGLSVGRAAAAHGMVGVVGDATEARIDGASYGLGDAARTLVLTGGTARLGSVFDEIGGLARPVRRAGVDAVTEGTASAVDQVIRTGRVDPRATLAASAGGLPGGYADGYVDLADVSARIDRTLPTAHGPDPRRDGIPSNRPMSAVEVEVFRETGLVVSGSAPANDE